LSANNSRPLLTDPRVRQAIIAAINRPQIVNTVLNPGTKPATSVLASTTPDYDNLGAQLVYNPTAAKNLLSAAGWLPGPNGIRVRDGVPLNLVLAWVPNLSTNQPMLELIQQQLKAVGIGVTLQENSVSTISSVQQSGNFDLFWGNLTRADPDVLRTQFSTKLGNYYRIPPGPLDAALDSEQTEIDPAARQSSADQAQQLVIQNGYEAPVAELLTVIGQSPKVHDLDFDASSRLQFHDTWLSP
jgi:peptide/nickel transport system substrate-binding protein